MIPRFISGNSFKDDRGELIFNNSIDLSQIKRFYTIRNKDVFFKRGWQGHEIEKRWYTAISGVFEINLILIDNWINPSNDLHRITYKLTDTSLDFLYIPPGYVTSIQSLNNNAKLLIMSDYKLHEIKDEYRFPIEYF